MNDEMRAICLGVHVVDVLVRPVQQIPEGQGGTLVEEIRITPAGSAGGAAITLAKLGARVQSAGAIGSDALGDTLIELLERFGVDPSLLVRRADVQTSASVLPIRPDGSRPAFHVVGANATYGSADAPWEAIEAASHLHLGAPEFMGGEEAATILSFARDHGVVTSADILAPGEQASAILDWIAPAFEHLDYLLPNDEQVLALTGSDEVEDGARRLLERGVGCVAATLGAEGAIVVDADGAERVPAFGVAVLDTTGCGDAFSAGFLRGLSLGRSRREAAVLGCAVSGERSRGPRLGPRRLQSRVNRSVCRGAGSMRTSLVRVAMAAVGLVGVVALAGAGSAQARLEVSVFARVPAPGYPADALVAKDGTVYAGTFHSFSSPSDTGPSKVFAYSPSGTLTRTYTISGQTPGAAHGVQVATADRNGNLYLLDQDPARVLKLDPKTGAQSTWATFASVPACPNNQPNGACTLGAGGNAPEPDFAAWGPDGSLYVTDYNQALIWRVSPSGRQGDGLAD